MIRYMQLKIIVALLALFCVLFFLPQLASTSVGKTLFTKAIQSKIQGKAEIETVHFSWFGPQILKHVNWVKNETKASIEQLTIHAPFWSFSGPLEIKNGTVSLDPSLAPVLGSTINLNGFVNFKNKKGNTDLEIESSRLKTILKANIIHNNLTIQEPLIASLSPSFGFLKDVQAQNPITLRIEPNGFSCPIPFSLEKLKIEKGTLDLGKITYQNGPTLAALVSFLHSSRLSQAKQMNIWSTPVQFQLNEAILRLDRVDFLIANSIHLCTWGTINLQKDEINMNLGLTASVLRSSFGIKNVSDPYVLKIPIRGSSKNIEFVTSGATAKIAALLAGEQIPKKGIFGGIADIFIKPKEDKEVPLAKRPFPWEK
jgi:hypothetical protein